MFPSAESGLGRPHLVVPFLETFQDDDSRFFDGSARYVDDGPGRMFGKEPSRKGELLFDVLAQRVVGLGRHPQLTKARLANLAELVETDGEPDDAILRRLFELAGGRHAEHEGQVGDLEPALSENRGKGRLRRARNADQHEVGLFEIARLFAVVALDGK